MTFKSNGGVAFKAITISGLAALAGASEFTGLGEAYDGTVGVGIAVGTLSYDIYQAAQSQ
ncbi:hypothetical protein [Pedobacter sp. CFBP9032]|uniref:hypothetical protein n=1 Tax=Pedobacter sp. CFBP9032 TaxID=3096539 RepID=UPI002A6A41A6|nr:hypothetical protein [Pedobacter sp. CFBP9032]